MNRALLVVVIAALCLGISGDDSKVHHREKRQKATKPPKPTKPPVCNKQNFDSLASCCSEKVGPFFTQDEIKTCANGKADLKLQKYASFQLHTLYDSKNKIVLNAKTLTAMSAVPCIVECLFFKRGLLDANNNTIYNSATSVFEKAASANWVSAGAPPKVDTGAASLMEEIVNECATSLAGVTIDTVTIKWDSKTKQTCLTKPALLLQCVRKTIADSCPPELYKNTASCNTTVSNLKTCGYFNTGVPYKV